MRYIFLLLLRLLIPLLSFAQCTEAFVQVGPCSRLIPSNAQFLITFQAKHYFDIERFRSYPPTFTLKTWNEAGPRWEIGVEITEAFLNPAGNVQLMLKPHTELPLGDSVGLHIIAEDALFSKASPPEAIENVKKTFEQEVQRHIWMVNSPTDQTLPPVFTRMQAETFFKPLSPMHGVTFWYQPYEFLFFEVKWEGKKIYTQGRQPGIIDFQFWPCWTNIPLEMDRFYELEVTPLDFAGNRGKPMIWSFWTASSFDDRRRIVCEEDLRPGYRMLIGHCEEELAALNAELKTPNLADSTRREILETARFLQERLTSARKSLTELEEAHQNSPREIRRRKEEEIPLLRWP